MQWKVLLTGKLHEYASFCNHSRSAYQMESRGVSLYTVFLHVALQTATGITGRNNITGETTSQGKQHHRHCHHILEVDTQVGPGIVSVCVNQHTPGV